MAKTAWVSGASGLVGGHLMTQLCNSEQYEKVIAFVRSPSSASWSKHPKVEQWAVNYDELPTYPQDTKVDDAFCALGTTAKKTPDKTEYYKIDVSYPLYFADLALKHGANYYGLVSAHGACEKSLSGYLKFKGLLEKQLHDRHFNHQAFARPSLLKGERDEFRLGEKFSEWFVDLMPGNYKAIDAKDVAASLIKAANTEQNGVQILSSSSMQRAAKV